MEILITMEPARWDRGSPTKSTQISPSSWLTEFKQNLILSLFHERPPLLRDHTIKWPFYTGLLYWFHSWLFDYSLSYQNIIYPIVMQWLSPTYTVKPGYNDHLMGYFSAFWGSSRWPITGNKSYYRGGRYRQVSMYHYPIQFLLGLKLIHWKWLRVINGL